tara:strand:+ start:37 stop:396 length:360 start_codon:yes stop_codon:yes gene_type:complete
MNDLLLKDKAIRFVYPNVVAVDLSNWECFDVNNNIVNVDDVLVQEKLNELEAEEPMRLLRVERNRLLSETDWWAVADRTMTSEQTAYRTALRDLPENSPNAALDEQGNLINVTWPTKPE